MSLNIFALLKDISLAQREGANFSAFDWQQQPSETKRNRLRGSFSRYQDWHLNV